MSLLPVGTAARPRLRPRVLWSGSVDQATRLPETVIAFAGAKWVFLVQFSGAEVMVVSMVAVQGRAVVLLVSKSPRCRASCAKKFACTLKTPQNWRFYACWANFFAEEPLKGRCGASFFAPIGPAPRSCRRCGARGWLRWGFCSIRSWLAACCRRVVPLMTPFPPFGGGPAAPSAASARAPSRWTSPRRARRRSLTTTSSRRRRNMSAALDRLKQQNEPE